MIVIQDFIRRIILSAVLILGTSLLLLYAQTLWAQWLTALCTASLSAIAIWEYGQFVKKKGGQMILPALIGIGIAQTLSFFFAALWFEGSWALPSLVFFVGFLILIALHFRDKNGAIVNLAVSSFGLIYIAIPMGLLLGIFYGSGTLQDGRFWICYLLIVTKISDVGAYFAGNLWGKRKLAPMISPGKTIEGAIGGLACSIFASLAFYAISDFSGTVRFSLGALEAIVLGALLGSIGQFGDLAESLLKRDANKKDSNTLPGLGGVLDLIDSLLFNSFIIFFYTQLL